MFYTFMQLQLATIRIYKNCQELLMILVLIMHVTSIYY